MKCIIHCPQSSVKWLTELFPGVSPYTVTIGNKPYLDFLIDFCVLAGIDEVRVLSDDQETDWQEYIGSGERWAIRISYAFTNGVSGRELVARNRGFAGDDDILIFQGMFCLHYDKRDFRMFDYASDAWSGEITPYGGGYMIIGRDAPADAVFVNRWRDDSHLLPRVEPLNSAMDFYQRNMELAYCDGPCYDMPGYSNEPNVYIGSNVVIDRTAEVNHPMILGDSIQLERGVRIGPGAVIGGNSLVDAKAVVVDSVVLGNSYISCNLEICGKIVCRNRVIDPATGIYLDVDESLLAPMVDKTEVRCSIVQRLLAAALMLMQLPLFLLLRPFVRLAREKSEYFIMPRRGPCRRVISRYSDRPAGNFAGSYFRKLSLDRFHLLPLVLRGDLRLVGNAMLKTDAAGSAMLEHFQDYAPGLFSLSELLYHSGDPMQMEIDELYYSYHSSFFLNMKILWQILLRNLLKVA